MQCLKLQCYLTNGNCECQGFMEGILLTERRDKDNVIAQMDQIRVHACFAITHDKDDLFPGSYPAMLQWRH